MNESDPPIDPHALQARLAAIVTSSDDAIISKDLNGIVQSWNDAAQRMFGYTAEEMIGQPITRLIPADRSQEEPQILARLARGERVDHFQTRRVRKDGNLIDVSVTISPILDSTGRAIGASKIARDISDLKRAELERARLLASEKAAREDAERISRLKDEFLATLSHELRTPLNAILGWTQLLRARTHPPDEMAHGLETIERNARVQTQLIEELLDVSRIISGKVHLDVQRVDLADVVQSALQSVLPAAHAKQITVSDMLDRTTGPIIGDAARLQQVVWNLLSNAIKFTPRGGRVQVVLRREDSRVQIVISDSGQGIKPEFLPHLFERFTQADSSTTRRHTGLGLGLAIVRHLVELHGGVVQAHNSGEGQGATFTVSLPVSAIAPLPESGQRIAPSVPAPAEGTDLSGVKVLIVDDESDARELVQRVLEFCNATVLCAASSNEGVEQVRRHRPHVLLSDIGMPGEDGYQLLARIRQLPEWEGGQTPAVALTAFARSEDRRRAIMAGFQVHLPKPVEAEELIAVVANVTGVRTKQPARIN